MIQEAEDSRAKAASMKMFGKLTRETVEWHPDKLLCKRFNIANPYPEYVYLFYSFFQVVFNFCNLFIIFICLECFKTVGWVKGGSTEIVENTATSPPQFPKVCFLGTA